MKVNEFWDLMCEQLNYRFFSGVACKGFDKIYKKMSADKMHYVPAVNESTALSIASGVTFTKIKSAVFIDKIGLKYLATVQEFITELKIPLLVFVYDADVNIIKKYKLPYTVLDEASDAKSLAKFINKIEKQNKIGLLVVKKGFIK